MTTVARVLDLARQYYDSDVIYRLPPQGYDAYVSIQDDPPYRGVFGGMVVQHCGISVAYLLYQAGLQPGRDFPTANAMQYAPSLIGWANVDGDPQVGDIGVINWPPKDGIQDHVTLVVNVDALGTDGTVTTWECNTTDDGRPYYYQRPVDWFDGFVRPTYSDTPPPVETWTPTTDEERVVRWLLDNTGWTTEGAAGVAGNIQQESSFNPTATESGRPFGELDKTPEGATAAGYGLCQWSFDRLWSATGLLAWCDAQGYDYSTIDGQLRFMLHEIGQYWPDLGQTLTTATDPVFAAQEFGRLFEGCGIEGARNQYAAEIHARMLAGDFGPLSPATVTPARIRRHIITGDDMSELIEVHKDQPANVPVEQRPHESHWLIAAGVPSRVESDGVAGPVNRHVSELEFYAWLQAWATANNLQIMQSATVGPAAGRPIFPPAA